ncbi:MAG: SGNH/GDSL hydrolase family protein [Acidobacteria bacterium]|nr:SGNH/GDSL hydrolase family protein [Acidobacteriota bacterium]
MSAAVILSMAAAHCGGKGPTAPPAGPFTQCPADIQLDSPDGGPVAVTYSAPGASGGTPPYEVTCTPPSGTAVGLGTSTVTCSVVDSTGRGTICSFNVTVVRPPRLALSRFLAFGDSLTEGVTNEMPTFRIVDYPNSYPQQLDALLRAHFRGQSLAVIPDGVGGELISGASQHSPGAQKRLPVDLDAARPEVVLLMEGTNDLTADPASPDDLLARAVDGMRKMIDQAQSRGVRVFLATIPPINPAGTKGISPEAAAEVPVFNDRLRALAQAEGVVLVDVHAAISARPDLMSSDGLHLNTLGYGAVAQLFFDAIKRELEIRDSLTP